MRSRIPWSTGMFYRLGQGHAIVSSPQEPGEYVLGQKWNLVCMFGMWDLLRDGVKVGHFFLSGMKVESRGSHIVTFMETKRGKADQSSVVVRCDDFLLFNFAHCGAMAISTAVSDHMQKILEGQ